jgi:hypothetical protein
MTQMIAETHHMVDLRVALAEAFEQFRKAFPSTRVMVYDDSLVYSTATGWSEKDAKYANTIIRQHNLPLEAINSKSFRNDSFIIKAAI